MNKEVYSITLSSQTVYTHYAIFGSADQNLYFDLVILFKDEKIKMIYRNLHEKHVVKEAVEEYPITEGKNYESANEVLNKISDKLISFLNSGKNVSDW